MLPTTSSRSASPCTTTTTSTTGTRPYFPAGLAATDPKRYTENWSYLLLPYIEQDNVYKQPFTTRAEYDTLVRPHVIPTYMCPSNPLPST